MTIDLIKDKKLNIIQNLFNNFKSKCKYYKRVLKILAVTKCDKIDVN